MPKRYGKLGSPEHRFNLMLAQLTPNDRAEVEQFKEFLHDRAKLAPDLLLMKHGTYMGFSTEEVQQVLGAPRA